MIFMKKFLSVLFTMLCVQFFCLSQAEANATQTKINWLTNYEDAVNQSKASSKPIVLFFTGSDWCGWCNKLDEEALDTADFAQAAGDKFIFVKLDFPLNTSLPPQQTAQNKQLQKKFDIRSFPTIVILDSQQQQQIGTTGYRPGGGKQYAQHLLKMVSDYSSYKGKMSSLDNHQLSGEALRDLYTQANELGLHNDAIKIVKAGMKSDEEQYFLTERYRFLVSEGQMRDQEALDLRERLLKSDPENENSIHYQVAVIDFEATCEDAAKENFSPEKAVAPLVAYINKFGDQDKSNLWRIQMIIAQVYFDKNKHSEALEYAQKAKDNAPASVQNEIALVIKNIQSQANSKE